MATFLENRALRRLAYKQALKDLKPLAKANAVNILKERQEALMSALAIRQAIVRSNKAKAKEAVSN